MKKKVPDQDNEAAVKKYLKKRHEIENISYISRRQEALLNHRKAHPANIYNFLHSSFRYGLSSAKALPENIMQIKNQTEGVATELKREWQRDNDVLAEEAKTAIGAQPKQLRKQYSEQLGQALDQILRSPIGSSATILTQLGVAAPASLVTAFEKARIMIDRITQMYLDSGFLAPQQYLAFQEHLGEYLHRSYMMHQSPNWWNVLNKRETEANARGEKGPIEVALDYVYSTYNAEAKVKTKWRSDVTPKITARTKALNNKRKVDTNKTAVLSSCRREKPERPSSVMPMEHRCGAPAVIETIPQATVRCASKGPRSGRPWPEVD